MEKGLILAGSDLTRLSGFKKGAKLALPAAFYTDRFPQGFERKQQFAAGLATSFIYDESYLSWPDFRRLADAGIEIASAGQHHRNLLFRNALHPSSHYMEEVEAEIFESKHLIEQQLGREVKGFIYPSGFYDEQVKRLVKRAGYEWAPTSRQGVNRPDADPYELRRIDIEFDDTVESIRQKITGRFTLRLARHPLISIIIPTYNRKRLLEPVLKSLMDQNYPKNKFEIIVVDDGGSDGSDRLVKELARDSKVKLRYLWQEKNGFRAGTARNLGAKRAKGELFLFLDGDVVAHPDLLLQHARFHNRWPDRVILGYVCAHTSLNTYNVPEVIKAVENRTLDTLPLMPELRDSIYSRCLDDLDRCQDYWMAFFSNNVSMPKQLFEQVGGFDDSFRGWGIEDNEMGYRLSQAGCRFVAARQAIGFHIGTEGELLNPYLSPDREKFRALRDNMQRFYDKYPDPKVKRFLVGLNVKMPQDYKLFMDEPHTHDLILGGECNNACTVCDSLGKKGQFRPTKHILDEMESLANRDTVWLRGGEPTIRDDLFEIIAAARSLGFKQIGLQTNGRAFAYLDFAIKAVREGATRFEIQLYGHTPELHDSITRTQGSFEQTMKGISNLTALGADVEVGIVLCAQNAGHRQGILALADSLGAEKVSIREIGREEVVDVQAAPRPTLLPEACPEVDQRGLGALLNRTYAGPKRVLVHIEKHCNLNCSFCGYHRQERRTSESYGSTLSGRFGLEAFRRLVEDLRLVGTPELGILGEGEPLIHPDIKEMVLLAKQAGLEVTLFTNGLLLHKDMVDAFCAAGLDRLHVNVSGGSPESYAALHPDHKGGFGRLVEQLKYLARKNRERRWGADVNLAHVITRQNYSDIPAMIRLSREVGADNTIFKPYVRTRMFALPEDPYLLREEDIRRFRALAPAIEAQLASAGIRSTFREFKDTVLGSQNADYTKNKYDEMPCLIGWWYCQISSDGEVSTCCMHKARMGNLNEQRFRDIWFSEKYCQFRSRIRDRSIPRQDPLCQRCENYQDNKEFFDKLAPLREQIYRTHPRPEILI